jgi:hypothetical protein
MSLAGNSAFDEEKKNICIIFFGKSERDYFGNRRIDLRILK